jgi:ubiquinone/menaquinone biosynthesis C-methylase UbiE
LSQKQQISSKVVPKGYSEIQKGIFDPFYGFYIFNWLPAFGLVISTHRNDIFAYFAGSIQRSKTVKEIEHAMRSARLETAKVKRMTHGVTAVVSGVKKKGKNG